MSIINREMVLEVLGRARVDRSTTFEKIDPTGRDPSIGIVCLGLLRADLLGLLLLRGVR